MIWGGFSFSLRIIMLVSARGSLPHYTGDLPTALGCRFTVLKTHWMWNLCPVKMVDYDEKLKRKPGHENPINLGKLPMILKPKCFGHSSRGSMGWPPNRRFGRCNSRYGRYALPFLHPWDDCISTYMQTIEIKHSCRFSYTSSSHGCKKGCRMWLIPWAVLNLNKFVGWMIWEVFHPEAYIVDLVGFNPFEKYARQIGSFPQVEVKLTKYLSCHQLVMKEILHKMML